MSADNDDGERIDIREIKRGRYDTCDRRWRSSPRFAVSKCDSSSGRTERDTMKSVVDRTAIALAIVGVMGAPGCSSYPVPNAKVASSEAAIRAAHETGSRDVPQAALHLKLAEEQLEQGKKLIRNNDNERASYVLSRRGRCRAGARALSRRRFQGEGGNCSRQRARRSQRRPHPLDSEDMENVMRRLSRSTLLTVGTAARRVRWCMRDDPGSAGAN